MRKIKLRKKQLLIPDAWEDLNFKEKIFTFKILMRVLKGDLKDMPHVGLLKLLIRYTGYRPVSFRYRHRKDMFVYYFKLFWIYVLNLPFLFRHGKKEYIEYVGVLKAARLPDPDAEQAEKEIIDIGLLKLAEGIDFVYKIDTEAKKIIPLYAFRKNPFPFIRIGNSKYIGKRFFVDLIAVTDITARCFVDTLDILMMLEKLTEREHINECINRICAILYPAIRENHRENMLSGHEKQMQKLDPVIKFGIVYWFKGVVNWFRENDTYRVIFERVKETGDGVEKISVGMNEIALFLKKEGYGNPDSMNLIDYFDAQVKALKDYVSKAIADGVKPATIATKAGIPLSTINKLS